MNKHLRIIGLSNELPEVGKPLIIPFGGYPHKTGKVMQLINEQSSAMMVAEFNTMKARSGFKGLPIFIGHPDVKGFYEKYPDHRSYGWVTGMLANEDHLELTVDWTTPGAELLTNEHFAYFSPNWLATRKGATEALPFKIKSIGLTHEPMIEYLALACEDGEDDEVITQKENTMDKFLDRLKALIGLDSVQTEDEVTSFVQKLIEGVRAIKEAQQARWKAEDAAYIALENEDALAGFTAYLELITTEAAAELALANESIPEAAQATLDQVNNELTLANEGLVTLRTTHSGLLLDGALSDGRITPATRSKWEDRFGAEGADFTELANELGSIDPTMKTSRAAKDAEPNEGGTATHADVITLANEYHADSKSSFESAYARAKRQPQFAHLFVSE